MVPIAPLFRPALRLLCGCLLAVQSALAAEPAMQSVVAELRAVEDERMFDGVVEAVNRSTVSAQVSGRIEEILVDVDDYVPAGTVVVRFRDPEQRAGLDQARAILREAEARARDAETEYARTRNIYDRKLVARAALDKADAERKATAARLEGARAAIAQAEEQVEHTLVRAPYSGIVTARHVEVGETANIGQPLLTGLSLDSLRVSVSVPQAFIEAVRAQRAARVLPLQDGQDAIAVESLTVFPQADPATHTFTVRAQLPVGVEGLFPGMLVRVAFTVGKAERLLIPASAVLHRSEVTGVYVLGEGDAISLRQLRLGARHGNEVEVLAGLAAGERIALDPVAATIALKGRAGRQQGGQPAPAH